ncbi:hypothetical protein [Candidatus Lokiarchaeum ossiferum]|uniref:hypothetical protein n=1 Tax=Candidatus Lokiarchaeum ossiferum TaxID=2951803 RepID=UPI00352D9A74
MMENRNEHLFQLNHLLRNGMRNSASIKTLISNNINSLIEIRDLFKNIINLPFFLVQLENVLKKDHISISEQQFNLFLEDSIKFIEETKENLILNHDNHECLSDFHYVTYFFYQISGIFNLIDVDTSNVILEEYILIVMEDKLINSFPFFEKTADMDDFDEVLNVFSTERGLIYSLLFAYFTNTYINHNNNNDIWEKYKHWFSTQIGKHEDYALFVMFTESLYYFAYLDLEFIETHFHALFQSQHDDYNKGAFYGYFSQSYGVYKPLYQLFIQNNFYKITLDSITEFSDRFQKNFAMNALIGYLMNEEELNNADETFPINLCFKHFELLETLIWFVWKQYQNDFLFANPKQNFDNKLLKLWKHCYDYLENCENTEHQYLVGKLAKWLICFTKYDIEFEFIIFQTCSKIGSVESAFFQDALLKHIIHQPEEIGALFYKLTVNENVIFDFSGRKINQILELMRSSSMKIEAEEIFEIYKENGIDLDRYK